MIVLHLYFTNKFKHYSNHAAFYCIYWFFQSCYTPFLYMYFKYEFRPACAREAATLYVLRAVLAFSFYMSLSSINEIFKYWSLNLNYLMRESLHLLCILVAIFLFAHCTSRRWWLPGTWCVGAYLCHHLDVNSSSPDLAGYVRCQPRQSWDFTDWLLSS